MSKVFATISSWFMVIVVFFQGFFGTLPAQEMPEIKQVKNVIVMIGDGTGFNSIEKTRKEENIQSFALDSFPLKGESKTRSFSDKVTDSAAGGTAIATGVRIINETVAVYPCDVTGTFVYPQTLAELAKEMGKSAGIVTTDLTSGATPASFSAHTYSRGNEAIITKQQLKSDLDLIWGYKTESFTEEAAKANGFEYIYDLESFEALENGTRSFGQFEEELWHNAESDKVPQLYEMTEKAIDILDDNDEGFFLMVEGAHIDKNNHNNNGEGMKDALQSFDKAIDSALTYARENGDTLVILTADHETGGITLENGEYVYTTGSHTGVNVPLYVYGCDNFIEPGEAIENRMIAQRAAAAMGAENFPRRVKA